MSRPFGLSVFGFGFSVFRFSAFPAETRDSSLEFPRQRFQFVARLWSVLCLENSECVSSGKAECPQKSPLPQILPTLTVIPLPQTHTQTHTRIFTHNRFPPEKCAIKSKQWNAKQNNTAHNKRIEVHLNCGHRKVHRTPYTVDRTPLRAESFENSELYELRRECFPP